MATAFTGGAPAVVGQILSYVQSVADARNNALTTSLSTLAAVASTAAKTGDITPLSSVVQAPLTLSDAQKFTLEDLRLTYGAETEKVAVDLADSFTSFLEDNFPPFKTYQDSFVNYADDWLTKALNPSEQGGGTGVNERVEEQIWARERARTLKEADRATDEAMTGWMSKGYSLPPGALVHQVAMINMAAQEKISESSRERAIKTFDLEIENVRLALGRSLDARNTAVGAATEYMRAVAVAPQLGLQVTQNVQAAHQRLNDVLLDFYKTDMEARDFVLKLRTSETQFSRDKENTDLGAVLKTLEQRVAATTTAAQMQGQQAAAALNGLHAQASIGGSDQTITSIQG